MTKKPIMDIDTENKTIFIRWDRKADYDFSDVKCLNGFEIVFDHDKKGNIIGVEFSYDR